MFFGIDLNQTFSFPFKDAESRKYFLIGCLVSLTAFIIPILPFFSFVWICHSHCETNNEQRISRAWSHGMTGAACSRMEPGCSASVSSIRIPIIDPYRTFVHILDRHADLDGQLKRL